MKKILCLLVLSLVLSFSVDSAAEKYINGVDKNHPPFAFVDEKNGKATGFDVDAMTWIANKKGFEVEHRLMEKDGIILELITGEIDMICSAMSITDESKMFVIFSDSYWNISKVFIVDKRSEMSIKDILSTEIKLGIKKGTVEAIEMAAEKNKYPLEILYYADVPAMLKDLLLGNIDVVMLDNYSAKDIIEKTNHFKIVGVHGGVEKFGVAFRKDDKYLKNIINDGYKQLKADPYWKELQDKYISKQ